MAFTASSPAPPKYVLYSNLLRVGSNLATKPSPRLNQGSWYSMPPKVVSNAPAVVGKFVEMV